MVSLDVKFRVLNLSEVCRCYEGVTKSYHLTYESIDTMRALFDKNRATNNWKINAKNLREYVEYFAPKTEQLDIYAEEGKCTFLAFTEKISHGKGTSPDEQNCTTLLKHHRGPQTTASDGRVNRNYRFYGIPSDGKLARRDKCQRLQKHGGTC